MKLNAKATKEETCRALNWLKKIIGNDIKKRAAGFEARDAKNGFVGPYWQEVFEMEDSLLSIWRHLDAGKPLPWNEPFTPALGFAVNAHRVHGQLTLKGRKRFTRMLLGTTNDSYGLRPVAFELVVATHLSRRGFNIHCADLSGSDRFDFLATRGQEIIEVECKTTSPDTGRKIHAHEAMRLAGHASSAMKQLLERGGGHLIRVTVADRLESSEQELKQIAAQITPDLTTEGTVPSAKANIEYRALPGGIPDQEAVRQLFRDSFGSDPGHILWRVRGSAFVALGIQSDKPDEVSEALIRQAKAAADQCTRTRPAVVGLQLLPMSMADLEMLTSRNGRLEYIVRQALRSEERRHVNLIAFQLPPEAQNGADPHTRELGGLVSFWTNPAPKFPSEAVSGLFKTKR